MANLTDKQSQLFTNMMWKSGNLSYKLHSGQLEIYKQIKKYITDGQKEFALRIARQYGKSYMTVVIALEMCLKNKGIIVRILGPTLDSIKSIVDDNLQPIIEDAPEGLIKRCKSEKRYIVGTSSLRIGTLERSHIDQTARGGNAFAIFCEECAASVKSEDLKYAVESVINPQLLRSSSKDHGGILAYITTPADMPEHYFHTDVEPKLMMRGTYFCKVVYDNPQLSEAQINLAMERCGGKDSEAWRREYLCEVFRSAKVCIVPEFNVQLHVSSFNIPQYKRLWTCIDFGGSRDHHHAILYYWDYDKDVLYIYDEVHAYNETSTPELLKQIEDMEACDDFGPIGRWGDLPGQLSVDLNRTYNFNITQTAKDDFESALSNLRSMFHTNKIMIHNRCTWTIKTLLAGRWNNQRTDFMRTEELGHCDAIDALLYASRNIDKADPRPNKNKHKTDGFNKLANVWQTK